MNYRVYCGVDFHARQQTICCLKTETGVITTQELKHGDKAAAGCWKGELTSLLNRPLGTSACANT